MNQFLDTIIGIKKKKKKEEKDNETPSMKNYRIWIIAL